MRVPTRERREISVRGIVQGVGFRPFVYALARRHGLSGLVRNDAEGVRIEAEGAPEDLEIFLRKVEEDAPPLAAVESVGWRPLAALGDRVFRIEESREGVRRRALVSPDVATCEDCLAELLDPANRRYRYPFTNCTNCGPRFTITRSVPYDRAATTMSDFEMCPACQREYDDPSDRRFHAQPNACPDCGPRARLLDRFGHELRVGPGDPIARTAQLLRGRAVVAIKGLGGYHLACDPFDAAAVGTLRGRKARQDKPFALMARDLAQVRELCRVTPEEEALLLSPARPIVLLERHEDGGVADEVAPRQRTLGVMLAYTPLHHLLLRDANIPLVMTSGNNSDEPIAYRDEEAFEQLCDIADFFLVHDRPIHTRCDDSVFGITGGGPYPLRRSRGYAPAPLRLAGGFARHILACGGELKNTFCLAKDRHAFPSHHVGDMENYETLRSFREGVEHYCRLFDVRPELVAYDLHPEYLATKYAREVEEDGLPAVGIQHHHAHVASCLADNERPATERVIGVAFDGTGYGTDGAVWGGEFFEGSLEGGFVRRAHLEYAPLPGGSAAIRQPWRVALAWLIKLYGEEETLKLPLGVVREAGERNARLVSRLVEHGLNTPPTSSAGRLFDAVAALVGVPGSARTTYEGQAAIELELAALGPTGRGYPFRLRPQGDGWVIETRGIVAAVVEDLLAGREAGEASSRFHRTMAEVVVAGCEKIREHGRTTAVALSGGTFQNRLLVEQVLELLEARGFAAYRHRRVPTNDGGLALGQAVLADNVFRDKGA
ncbi:MAG: [NiFe] hydrogenase metallocenter assembly protein HypF [uncultured Rubrobacteraceae bacterium]|uniref:Carbamoyltransferase n=1 Tax=uncultured Rubrobacteraceae bacterium TaxID=349277 RepID=A0A6J4RS18_9ACTN|nr:MAG: [NiFe] hydrogenase metallocenter assembly protein HypF [uncultured Rubrobacteraceae bacterium]